jgi:DNA polymerase III alpha subunit
VRLGLAAVRGVSERTRARLLATRGAEGPFVSLADFVARVRPSLEEALSLCDAGAFDLWGRTRASLRCEARATHAAYRDSEPEGVFRVRRSPVEVPALEEFPLRARYVQEWRALGIGVRAHPFELAVPELLPSSEASASAHGPAERRRRRRAQGWLPACDAEAAVGRRARVAGVAAAWRRVETVRGERMLFLTLDDGTGIVECTLFPEAYRRSATALSGMGPFVAEGRIASSYGAITLETDRVLPWGHGRGATETNGVRHGGPAA